MPLDLSLLLANKHPDKLIYSGTALLKHFQYYGVTLENKTVFFIRCVTAPRLTLTLNVVLHKKIYV